MAEKKKSKDRSPATVPKPKKNMVPLDLEETRIADEAFSELIKEMRKHTVPDIEALTRAYRFAFEKHNGVRRKSGDAYIMHPIAVAMILAEQGYESDMVEGALLHDVVEDCGVTVEDLTKKFGRTVAHIVDAVSAVDDIIDEPGISHSDLDSLTDIKLLTAVEVNNNKKAIYIKLADRIHNLRTIGGFPQHKIHAKVENTRNVLLPEARRLHIFTLVDILEDLCMKLDDPDRYNLISNAYEWLIHECEYGTKKFLDYHTDLFSGNCAELDDDMNKLSSNIARQMFHYRTVSSISRATLTIAANAADLLQNINKDNVALLDLFFIIKDECGFTPWELFSKYFPYMQESPLRIAITKVDFTKYGRYAYYEIKDCWENKYRLFLQTESEYLESRHGALLTGEEEDEFDGVRIRSNDPTVLERPQMVVYRRDGSKMQIEIGASALDFAFAIHPEVGLCAREAIINGAHRGLYTRLQEGDRIDIVTDANKNNPALSTFHATVRWFEYLVTRNAIHDLSRWMELHMDAGIPMIAVSDSDGNPYNIEMASTVLDFAFMINAKKALHTRAIYVNNSKKPVALSYMLRYHDSVKIEYDDKPTAAIEWFSIVKSKKAIKKLVSYFSDQK